MEDNNTDVKNSQNIPQDIKNISLDLFIEKISKNLSIKKKIHITGKILNYITEKEDKEKTIYFAFNVFKKTEINPFISDVLIDIEFSQNKIPYARLRSDFILPSMYDNRNFFYCLTNEHDFIYNYKELDKLENVLNEIINKGIENLLFCLKENSEINSFIYYGEYKLRSIYNMNDFLENYKLIKFYRVNQVLDKGKKIDEKYIVVTQLYFLIFKPLENDKTFAELIFLINLKKIIFEYKKSFCQKLNSNTLILYIEDNYTPIGKKYEFEFAFIDRSRPPVVRKYEVEDSEEDEVNKNKDLNSNNKNDEKHDDKKEDNENKNNKNKINKNDNNKQLINENKDIKKDIKSNDDNKNNINNIKIINNNIIKNEENDEWDKYYQFEEEIEKKQKEINFKKYKLVIENYKPLFNHRSIEEEKKENELIYKSIIMDYEKMFNHCEEIYNYYLKKNDNKKYKKRMEYYIVNITFFCAELIRFYDLEKSNYHKYFDKMKYYLNLNEKNQ